MRRTIFGFIAPSLLRRSTISSVHIINKMSPSNNPPSNGSTICATAQGTADPHLWLEDVLGEKPLAWVEEVNKKCIDDVGDPKETESYKRIKDILDSKVRAG